MYWMPGLCPEVTWAGLDQCCPPSAELDISTASSTPGPLAFHTWNIRPVAWSPAIMGRQRRMPAGPPPMFLATTTGLLHVAPPSKEVRATIEVPLPAAVPFRRMNPCLEPLPNAWPENRYVSVIAPSGWTNGCEF